MIINRINLDLFNLDKGLNVNTENKQAAGYANQLAKFYSRHLEGLDRELFIREAKPHYLVLWDDPNNVSALLALGDLISKYSKMEHFDGLVEYLAARKYGAPFTPGMQKVIDKLHQDIENKTADAIANAKWYLESILVLNPDDIKANAALDKPVKNEDKFDISAYLGLIADLKRTLETNPDDNQILVGLGDLYSQNNKGSKRALMCYTQARKQGAGITSKMGEVIEFLHQDIEKKRIDVSFDPRWHFEQILKLNPNDTKAFFGLRKLTTGEKMLSQDEQNFLDKSNTLKKELEKAPNDPALLLALGDLHFDWNETFVSKVSEDLNFYICARKYGADLTPRMQQIIDSLFAQNAEEDALKIYGTIGLKDNLDSILDLDPNNIQALLDLGGLLSDELGEHKAAISLYRKAADLAPDDARPFFHKACAHYNDDDPYLYCKSLVLYAATLCPDDEYTRYMRSFAEPGIDASDEKEEEGFEEELEAVFKKNSAKWLQSRLAAVIKNPNDADALNGLGSFYNDEVEAFDTAIGYFDKACQADPNCPVPRYNLSIAQFNAGLDKYIYLPNLYIAARLKPTGFCLEDIQTFAKEEGVSDIVAVILAGKGTKTPSMINSNQKKIDALFIEIDQMLLEKTKDIDWRVLEAAYIKILAIDPNNLKALLGRGDLYQQKEIYALAANDYAIAVAFGSPITKEMRDLINTFIPMIDSWKLQENPAVWGTMFEHLTHILAIEPDHAYALTAMGDLLNDSYLKYAEAQIFYERAAIISPMDVQCRLNLAIVKSNQDRPVEELWEDILAAAKLDPYHDPICVFCEEIGELDAYDEMIAAILHDNEKAKDTEPKPATETSTPAINAPWMLLAALAGLGMKHFAAGTIEKDNRSKATKEQKEGHR